MSLNFQDTLKKAEAGDIDIERPIRPLGAYQLHSCNRWRRFAVHLPSQSGNSQGCCCRIGLYPHVVAKGYFHPLILAAHEKAPPVSQASNHGLVAIRSRRRFDIAPTGQSMSAQGKAALRRRSPG